MMYPTIWRVKQLRLTFFVAPDIEFDSRGWWAGLTGQPAETRTEQPRLATRQDAGSILTPPATLVLNSQPGRVDWILNPRELGTAEGGDLTTETIGVFEPVLSEFLELVRPWYDHSPDVIRLALGADLVTEVEGHDAGYEFLGRYLDIPIDPDTKDFLYRINKPSVSTTLPATQVNRLTTWSVIVAKHVSVNIGPSSVASSETARYHGARLELDINTSKDRRDFVPASAFGAVVGELRDIAVQLSTTGWKQ